MTVGARRGGSGDADTGSVTDAIRYPALFSKGRELDERLQKGDTPSAEDIAAYLDLVVDSTHSLYDPSQLNAVLTSFRRWETLLLVLHGIVYRRIPEIDTTTDRPEQQIPATSVGRKARESVRDNDGQRRQYWWLRLLDPRDPHLGGVLEKLDPTFVQRHRSITGLTQATAAFKSSRLLESARLFHKHKLAFERRSTEPAEPLDWYFYAWSLHGLGSVFLALDDYVAGRSLLGASLHIKSQLQGLPRILVELTRAKYEYTTVAIGDVPQWNEALRRVLDEVLATESDLRPPAPKLYQGLVPELMYHLAKSYQALRQEDRAAEFFSKALELTKRRDQVMALRIRINSIPSAFSHPDGIAVLERAVGSLTVERRANVFIRRTANEWYLEELRAYFGKEYAASVRAIYRAAKIIPLERDYTASYLLEKLGVDPTDVLRHRVDVLSAATGVQ